MIKMPETIQRECQETRREVNQNIRSSLKYMDNVQRVQTNYQAFLVCETFKTTCIHIPSRLLTPMKMENILYFQDNVPRTVRTSKQAL
jgi:hypothetical protein